MEITKFGHSCLQVRDRDANVLIDPGVFSPGFETLTGLTAILVTHGHADHLDAARIARLTAANPDADVYADAAAAEELAKVGVSAAVATAGQVFDVGTKVETFGEQHAVIHDDLPRATNVGYLLGERLYHPGDALFVPEKTIEILALPAMAPWMALKEAIDYQRAVGPRSSIPIHEKLLANTDMYYGRLENMGPDGMRWLNLDDGNTREV
jgi:L-ascorbate metabolism protein UlaG (beta-lactamase superfamily)